METTIMGGDIHPSSSFDTVETPMLHDLNTVVYYNSIVLIPKIPST